MTWYETTPGEPAEAPALWPEASTIALSGDSPTLIMLAHPQCPCTKATLHELELLLSQVKSEIRTYVVFVKPEGFPYGWANSSLMATARAIPGVIVMTDENGVEANRFHGRTSGQTALYDRSGNLLFKGGLTGARGVKGSNDGSRSILRLIDSQTAVIDQTPVYGCPIFDPNRKKGDECDPGDHK